MPINTSDLIPVGLTGNVTIQQKAAQFTKTVVIDNTLEGPEKFVARLRKNSTTGPILASTGIVTIRDTSVSDPLPTYSLSANVATVTENSSVQFALTTTNISANTQIPYTISGQGITSADINNAPLTGSFTVSATGTAFVVITISADLTTEGPETLTLTLNNIVPIVSSSVIINDTSITPPSLPTYSLSVNSTVVQEGGSVTFTLTTTNVANGTRVPWSITGVSTADIGRALTGEFVIGTTGSASEVISIANDSIVEGTETMILTLSGITPVVSRSVAITDMTIPPPTNPTYTLTSNRSSVNEGEQVVITLTTTNVTNGTRVPYSISGNGITPADFGGILLTGDFIIQNQQASLTLNVTTDGTTEGNEEFKVSLVNVAGVSVSVIINDTSRNPIVPSFALAADKQSINEGESVVFTLTATNVPVGTSIPYKIEGPNITTGDLGGAQLTGNFLVSVTGVAEIRLTLTASLDQFTEGDEQITLSLINVPNASVSVNIRDTSRSPVPSYALNYDIPGYNQSYIITPLQITINNLFLRYLGRNAEPEGLNFYRDGIIDGRFQLADVEQSIRNSPEALLWDGRRIAIENNDVVVITLTTSNVPVNTVVPYTISGVNAADLSNAPLTGSFTVGADGKASISLTTSPDRLTEGIETVTVTLNTISPTVSTSFRIYDTSKAPTYALTSNVAAVNEGLSVSITLTTTEVADGTRIPFTLSGSGIDNNDLAAPGRLVWNAGANRFEGEFIVFNNTSTLTVNTISDAATEGAESFNVTLSAITPTVTRTITINDTSVVQTGSGILIIPGLSATVATLPAEATWVAFRMLGAGGSGGGSDEGGDAGSGIFSSQLSGHAGWSTNLTLSSIYTNSVPFDITVPVYIPATGTYSFKFTTDNSGSFQFDGGQTYSWNDFSSDLTGSIQLQAGQRQLRLTCSNSGGPYGVGLQLYNSEGYLVYNTKQAAITGGGSGAAGAYIEGVVRLPATSGSKILRGGVGAPGIGGARYTSSGATQKESGGRGFGSASFVTIPGGLFVTNGGDGGAGGQVGPNNQSGQGGAGGGASCLYYYTGSGTGTDTVVTNIAVAGGGAGAGGKAKNQNQPTSHGNPTNPALLSTINGQDSPYGDGSGGGGGGGYQGQGGGGGADNGQRSSGGSSGSIFRNTNLTWNTSNEYSSPYNSTSIPPGSTFTNPGVPVSAQPSPVLLGRGGQGHLTIGNWPAFTATNGSSGAIALYWTTSLTPPSLNSVPAFGDASAFLTVQMPAAQDAPGGVIFHADGTVNINGAISTWIVGAGINGAGEWYEIKYVSMNPSNGSAQGAVESNLGENAWNPMFGTGALGYYFRVSQDAADIEVSIRRRTNKQIVGTTRFRNLGT